MAEAKLSGTVIRLHGLHCIVASGAREIECSVRGRLKKGRREAKSPVAVGDEVNVTLEGETTGAIDEVKPRKTELIRHSADGRVTQVLAANVERLFAVVAADKAAASLLALDKLLAAALMQNLQPVIVVNKSDLANAAETARLFAAYRAAQFPLLMVSAKSGEGLQALREMLASRLSVFCGPSGVGKTSLLNALQPELALRVGEVDRHGEGRHTTTNAALLNVAGGRVVDTPGLRDFTLANFNLDELSLFYPDFAPFREKCKFALCTHRHEPKCAVREAAETGKLDLDRYQRYLTILRESWNEELKRKARVEKR